MPCLSGRGLPSRCDTPAGYWEPAKWVAKLRRAKTDSNLLLLKCDMGAGHFRQAPTPLPGCWCTLLHATVPVAVERVHASLSCFGSQLLPAPQAAVT